VPTFGNTLPSNAMARSVMSILITSELQLNAAAIPNATQLNFEIFMYLSFKDT
jgi:hypothetical protein